MKPLLQTCEEIVQTKPKTRTFDTSLFLATHLNTTNATATDLNLSNQSSSHCLTEAEVKPVLCLIATALALTLI